ncbi:platelet-activating factor receptor-like [Dromiciops gliroides]|uniref:platelet-activating factor receptor-like n=1 Tax=Dromiciops gliroides TaxID=33562 RepID=UPI001CC768E7|nr:platelet-activating factor receptor-like [Dromiciops gliroides]
MNNTEAGAGVRGCGPWDDPARFIVVPAAYAVALSLGLPANLAALAVFGRGGGRLGQALRLYLLNLAVADILFTLTLPFWLTYYLGRAHWPFPDSVCHVTGAIYYAATYAAISFMVLISASRYCTVQGPKPGFGTRLPLNQLRVAQAACTATWMLCLACAAPSLVSARALRPGPGGTTRCFEHGWARQDMAYITVAFFTAAFLLVLGAYISLARVLAVPPASRRASLGPLATGSHRRMARTMVLGLLLVFAVCLAPYHLILAPWVARQDGDEGNNGDSECPVPSTLDVLHTLSLALLSLNSCLDPLVYCFSLRRFRQDCRGLSCCPGSRGTKAQAASCSSS